MRAFKRHSRSGFTLVELMIVVAIIGVLAALAIYGVRRYLQSAKTSEAKNSVGAITRGSVGAYERETTANEALSEGGTSAAFSHDLCGPAKVVPTGNAPPGTKYQPDSAAGCDFETGNGLSGWKCLKFTMTNPVYYQYHYFAEPQGTPADPDSEAIIAPAGATMDPAYVGGTGTFIAYAVGDLDADSQNSVFSRNGYVNTDTRTVITSTQVYVNQEFE